MKRFNEAVFRAGRMFGPWILLILAIYGTPKSVRRAVDGWQSRDWVAVEAVVAGSSIQEEARGVDPVIYRGHIRYRYHFDGQTMESNNIGYCSTIFGESREQIESLVGKYSIGATTLAYVNPRDPTDAVLEIGIQRSCVVSILFVLGLWTSLGIVAWMKRTR